MQILALLLLAATLVSQENPFDIISKIPGALPNSISLSFSGLNNTNNGIEYNISIAKQHYKIFCYDCRKEDYHYYSQLEEEMKSNVEKGIKYTSMRGPNYTAIIKIDTAYAVPGTENIDLYAKFEDGSKYISIHSLGNKRESVERLMINLFHFNVLDKSIRYAKELPTQTLNGSEPRKTPSQSDAQSPAP
jgi:hypothetical protein